MQLCFGGRSYKLDHYTPEGYNGLYYVMSFSLQRIGAALVLMSFLTLTLLSFSVMMHESDGRMQGDCPFSAAGVPSCPSDALSAAIHHISAYQSLLGVTGGSGTTVSIVALLLFLFAALIFSIRAPLRRPPILGGYCYHPSPSSPARKIMRWLSLFENSPSHA